MSLVACHTMNSSRGMGVMVNPGDAWRSATARCGARWSVISRVWHDLVAKAKRVETIRQKTERIRLELCLVRGRRFTYVEDIAETLA